MTTSTTTLPANATPCTSCGKRASDGRRFVGKDGALLVACSWCYAAAFRRKLVATSGAARN
jgi:hypothetical protein